MKVGDKVIAHHNKGASLYYRVISVTEDKINLYVITGATGRRYIMKKYFYTCPLKAAFMAKYHGMRFWNLAHEIIVLPLLDAEDEYKRYIHPDSLNLLEPQAGDLVEFSDIADVPEYVQDKKGEWFIGYYKTEISPYQRIMLLNEHFLLYAQAMRHKILQRNGEAWFAPESEQMIEKAVDMDDALLEKYLAGEEPSEADLKRCIRAPLWWLWGRLPSSMMR